MSDEQEEPWGFCVRYKGGYEVKGWPLTTIARWVPPGWSVELPHQCDSWTIAEMEPRDRAVQLLQEFIDEAQAALTALQAGRPYGDPSKI